MKNRNNIYIENLEKIFFLYIYTLKNNLLCEIIG